MFRIISGLWPVFGGELCVPKPCECAHCAAEPGAPPHCLARPVMFYIPQRSVCTRPSAAAGSCLGAVLINVILKVSLT